MKPRVKTDLVVQLIACSLGLALLFPILYALSVSFMEHRHVLANPPHLIPPTVTLENYKLAFTRTELPRYLVNSFVVAMISMVSRLIIGAMAAFAFAFFEFKGKRILFALTLATIMIPPDVLVVPNYMIVSKLGLVNTYLGICAIFLVSATNIFILRQSFLTFAVSLREAAYIDGCNNVRFFLRILLPISRPVLMTVALSSFVNLWNQYVWPLLVTNRNDMRTIQVGITMLKDRESSIFGPVMAGVIVALIPTIVIFILSQRQIVFGMMSGAVKE